VEKKLRMKIRHLELGGHTHLTFFASMVLDFEKRYTLGNCGTVTLTNDEFAAFSRFIETHQHNGVDDALIEFEKGA